VFCVICITQYKLLFYTSPQHFWIQRKIKYNLFWL